MIDAPVGQVGALLDTLASDQDQLWPWENWPALRLRPGLEVGGTGGHRPVRYRVIEYVPGSRVRFKFLGPTGFNGHHEFAVAEGSAGTCVISHRLVIAPTGPARLSWPMVFRPLHDALTEEAFDKAAAHAGGSQPMSTHRRSAYVRFLRSLLTRLV